MNSAPRVVVVGLGHAGVEAGLAAARLGAEVVGVTQVAARIGLMSCNPAVGGPGKSQLVREIDALGGAMAMAADCSAIQVRRLNASKGQASWATRVQVDRLAYAAAVQRAVGEVRGLRVLTDEVVKLWSAGGRVQGVVLKSGGRLEADAVVITTGTFLRARLHTGETTVPGGRAGDGASNGLSLALRGLGCALGRFKTGTPPRLEGRTIDFARCAPQPSCPEVGPLSARTPRAGPSAFPQLAQRSTHLTRTNNATHQMVRDALHRSPLTTGQVTSRGPRYCPSLEQKVQAYPDRASHLVYLEPDGLTTTEVYPAGLSTSLPVEVQVALLRTISGLESVELRQAGYAVEYDYLVTGQLRAGFGSAAVPGLYFAGQITGSSGYEEAAGQGLVAGVNAVREAQGQEAWVPNRARCYLGVLCDDLVNKGFSEPYRLMPGRAEARLTLREGNAGLRLGGEAARLGLIDGSAARRWQALSAEIAALRRRLTPDEARWLRHPERTLQQARGAGECLSGVDEEVAEEVFLSERYEPYQTQRSVAAARLWREGDRPIPPNLRFEAVPGLSAEARSALSRARPLRLAEVFGLPGVEDSAVAILGAHLRRRDRLAVPRGTPERDD